MLIPLCFLLFAAQCHSKFSDEFRRFLRDNFGEDVQDRLERTDLGVLGSFGGGDGTNIDKTPIVFVHGIMNTAGTMSLLKTFFQGKGYSEDELYATSYGPKGSRVMPETGAAHCDYVKSVRYLIEGVSAFTKRPVAVISYSMGVIVSRKAILGGKCVDTGKDLGEPLTDRIETYIGIAGPNHGAFLCSKYLVLGKYVEACDRNNGMRCGSKYLDDINSKERYEAKRIFAIQTLPDEIVGNFICGNPDATSTIDGAEQMITVYGMQHTNVWLLTAPIQYDLLTNTKPRPAQLTLTDKVVKSFGKTMAGLESAFDSSIGQLFDKFG